jgi:hypothetical protein
MIKLESREDKINFLNNFQSGCESLATFIPPLGMVFFDKGLYYLPDGAVMNEPEFDKAVRRFGNTSVIKAMVIK